MLANSHLGRRKMLSLLVPRVLELFLLSLCVVDVLRVVRPWRRIKLWLLQPSEFS